MCELRGGCECEFERYGRNDEGERGEMKNEHLGGASDREGRGARNCKYSPERQNDRRTDRQTGKIREPFRLK